MQFVLLVSLKEKEESTLSLFDLRSAPGNGSMGP